MESCVRFLEKKLKLKVNVNKSSTGCPTKLKFLGFSLFHDKDKKQIGIRVHEKSQTRLKDKLRLQTSRKVSSSITQILEKISRQINGWLLYFSIAEMKFYLRNLGEWLRRRVRQLHWKPWKQIRTRFDKLIKLGVPQNKAWQWANSRKGYWRIAGSLILHTTLTNSYLETLGFPNILKRYEELQERARRMKMLHVTH
jgi:hypothetical protein